MFMWKNMTIVNKMNLLVNLNYIITNDFINLS